MKYRVTFAKIEIHIKYRIFLFNFVDSFTFETIKDIKGNLYWMSVSN
jgi:hypothetical protein